MKNSPDTIFDIRKVLFHRANINLKQKTGKLITDLSPEPQENAIKLIKDTMNKPKNKDKPFDKIYLPQQKLIKIVNQRELDIRKN